VIGATKESHLETAIGSLEVVLTQEEINYMEEPYVPHHIVGFK
jgi:aryl-alcohol dehydrogenase-like predicted oxidoreductase